jgi:3-oxoadipate enol-lactonase
MLNAYQSGDKRRAVEIFADPVFGPNWQPVVEQAVPGGVEQAIKDADTFMEEQATIQEWQFGPAQAAAIRQPVLSVLGVRSTPFMKKGREMLHAWLPQTEDLDLDTTHLLQMQDPEGVARGLVTFFGRHPMRS